MSLAERLRIRKRKGQQVSPDQSRVEPVVDPEIAPRQHGLDAALRAIWCNRNLWTLATGNQTRELPLLGGLFLDTSRNPQTGTYSERLAVTDFGSHETYFFRLRPAVPPHDDPQNPFYANNEVFVTDDGFPLYKLYDSRAFTQVPQDTDGNYGRSLEEGDLERRIQTILAQAELDGLMRNPTAYLESHSS